MDMQDYIAIIEKIIDGLGIPGVYLATGIVAFCVLATLLSMANSSVKTGQLRKARAREQEKHEAALAELISQSQSLQTHALQLEKQLQQKTGDHQQLEQHINDRIGTIRQLLKDLEKNPELQGSATADIDNAPETLLWQQHSLMVNELNGRLQNYGRQAAKLSAQNRAYKTQINRLEVARMQVFNELNQKTGKIRQLESAFSAKLAQQQAKNDTQESQNHALKATIDKLELNRMQVFNELNQATQKIHALESLHTRQQAQQENAGQTLAKLETESLAQKATIEEQSTKLAQAAKDLQVAADKMIQLETALKNQQPSVSTTENPAQQPPEQSGGIAESLHEDGPTTQTASPEPIQANPFSRFASHLGFGKQQAPAQENEGTEALPSRQENTTAAISEEKPAEQVQIEAAETKASNPFFNKARNAFGLGKQQAIEDVDVGVKEQEEPAQAAVVEATEKPKPANPLLNKLITSIGLNRSAAPEPAPEPEVKQEAEETPSAVPNNAVRNAKQITGQLKNFFKK